MLPLNFVREAKAGTQRFLGVALFPFLFLAFALSPASAQEQGKTVVRPPDYSPEQQAAAGPVVKDIEIEFAGPRSVDRSVILSNMRTTIGQPYSASSVEEDVRNLYATGLFVNLRIYDEPVADGVKVVVVVQPKPIIKEIVVAGAERISEKAVRKKITSKPGDPLNEQKIAADAQAVKTYYFDKGFPDALVEYKIDINEQIGRATVSYTVKEGSKAYITDIEFIGLQNIDLKKLKKVMKTREKNIFSFINKSGVMKDEQIDQDLRAVREYLQNQGYIDAVIEDVSYESNEDGEIKMVLKIFQGIQYHVGKIDFRGNTLFTRDQIIERMTMLENSVFSPAGLNGDVKAIRDLYGEKGYIDAEVFAERQPNIESGKMDILYSVKEGPESFVEKIVVQGNNRTKDKVIRRELALAPGEVYDSVSADASKKRLENLGYFSKVDVSPRETDIPNRKDMVVTVEEQRTGSVTFGAGFSTIDSLLGFVELTQSNFDIANPSSFFTGGGQKFRTRIQYGLRRRDALISWTEPWFLNRKLSLGFDLFYNDANYLSSRYDQERYGAAVRVGKALNQFWRVDLRYQIENIRIYDVDNDAPDFLKEEEGSRTKSSVRATLTYDTRDDLFLTRRGEKVEMSAEGAGGPLLGDTNIWKLELEAQKFWQLPYDLIFSLKGATGVVNHYGDSDKVPIFDRFFIGGSRSVRGFDFRDVGPREDGEPEGGLTMAYTNAELTFPIFDRVRGAVFVDAGFNNEDVFDYTVSDVQVGTGFGLRLNLPIGPLRLDLGFPVVYDEDNDSLVKFHFDVGYQF